MAKKKAAMQPEVSIGLVGHVDHGKTTLVRSLSGKWTDTHSEELKRGITIKLGYADLDIYKSADGWTIDPKTGSKTNELARKVSLVDAPGHESLMATMLSGANIMDGALLIVSASEPCPQLQTREHVQALSITGIKNVIVVQNKIDLVSEEQAKAHHKQIKEFLAGTDYEDAPIVPLSAVHHLNINYLLQAIQEHIPTPERDDKKDPLLFVARSFDINKPGTVPNDMVGGILGGAIREGVFKKGMELEIVPGYEVEERNQKVWRPLTTKLTSIVAGGNDLDEVRPGGSVAFMTELDPVIVKSDKLVGRVVGRAGKVPPVWHTLSITPKLLERVVGADEHLVVEPIHRTEPLMLNVNSAATVGIVTEVDKKGVTLKLKRPVAAAVASRVTISRNLGKRWRLIGYGTIKE